MNDKLKVCTAMLSMAASIVLYSMYRCKHADFEDVLQKFPFGGEDSAYKSILDGWSCSHFMFFASLGYFFPNEGVLALGMGATWEFLEFLTQHTKVPALDRIRGLSECRNRISSESGGWWYAKGTDLLMNAGGFLFGRAIRPSPCY